MTSAPDGDDVIEKMAKAIWRADGFSDHDDNSWLGPAVSDETREQVRDEARGALSILLEHFNANELAELTTWDAAALRYSPNAEIASLRAQLAASTERAESAERALALILPLAKGYHPPNQTDTAKATCRKWIAEAEDHFARHPEGEKT